MTAEDAQRLLKAAVDQKSERDGEAILLRRRKNDLSR
jgi:hypothetical protein